jgi:hypothetical protein
MAARTMLIVSAPYTGNLSDDNTFRVMEPLPFGYSANPLRLTDADLRSRIRPLTNPNPWLHRKNVAT